MVTDSHTRNGKYDKNSLNYPFPSQLMKTTQSDIIVIIGGNIEASKTVQSVFCN